MDVGTDVDPSLYPNITALFRVGFRGIEAHVGRRRFRVTIYEALHDRRPPVFSTNYEEEIEILIDGELRPLYVKADLPWAAADSIDECLRAALHHVNVA